MTLDIERVETQKVLEYSCDIHSRNTHFFLVLQHLSSWKHSHPDGCVTFPSFLCIRWGYVPEHWSMGCDSDMWKFSELLLKGGLCLSLSLFPGSWDVLMAVGIRAAILDHKQLKQIVGRRRGWGWGGWSLGTVDIGGSTQQALDQLCCRDKT